MCRNVNVMAQPQQLTKKAQCTILSLITPYNYGRRCSNYGVSAARRRLVTSTTSTDRLTASHAQRLRASRSGHSMAIQRSFVAIIPFSSYGLLMLSFPNILHRLRASPARRRQGLMCWPSLRHEEMKKQKSK